MIEKVVGSSLKFEKMVGRNFTRLWNVTNHKGLWVGRVEEIATGKKPLQFFSVQERSITSKEVFYIFAFMSSREDYTMFDKDGNKILRKVRKGKKGQLK